MHGGNATQSNPIVTTMRRLKRTTISIQHTNRHRMQKCNNHEVFNCDAFAWSMGEGVCTLFEGCATLQPGSENWRDEYPHEPRGHRTPKETFVWLHGQHVMEQVVGNWTWYDTDLSRDGQSWKLDGILKFHESMIKSTWPVAEYPDDYVVLLWLQIIVIQQQQLK